MYSQGTTDRTKPNDRSDPYETEFTAKAWNETVQSREREEALVAYWLMLFQD